MKLARDAGRAGLGFVAALTGAALLTVPAAPCAGQGVSVSSGATGTKTAAPARPAEPQPPRETLQLSLADGLDHITASAGVEHGPPRFLLKLGDTAFGPFNYDSVTVTDLADYGAYDLKLRKEGVFSLKSLTDGRLYGPFAYKEGAKIALGTNTFVLAMAPFEIKGALKVRRPSLGGIQISLIKVTPEMLKDAIRLRSEFRGFEREAAAQTAPRKVPGPTVSGMGRDRSPWAEPSRLDRGRSLDSAARKAAAALDAYIRKYRTRSIKAGVSGDFKFADLEPSAYVVCATGMLTGGGRDDPPAQQVVWWANVSMEGGSAGVNFSEQNAYACKTLFLPW